MQRKRYSMIETPLGTIYLQEFQGAITQISLQKPEGTQEATPLLEAALQELTEYFGGARQQFTFPINPQGTIFQKQVWNALLQIPYGETKSYGDIAKDIGNPKACRAIGSANHNNPLLIVVPCHRVIGKNGTLTGYACGLEKKSYLLDLEKSYK